MSVPLPEEIRRTGQVIPYKTLKAWAEESGFVVRRSNRSSHASYWHKDYPDISNTFIDTSDKLASQREFAKMLEELHLRKLADSFKAASDKKQKVLDLVPPHLSAEFDHETGSLVIRDKQLPQLGITVRPDDFALIENKIRNILEPKKREIFVSLGRCRTEYDMHVNIPKRGVFDGILSHNVYGIPPVAIPPYKAGDDIGQFESYITHYMALVQEQDREHEDRLNRILGMPFVSEIDVVSTAYRGERTYIVHCKSPKNHELPVEFHAQSYRRVTLAREEKNPHRPADLHRGRISEMELAGLERRMLGLSAAHARAELNVH